VRGGLTHCAPGNVTRNQRERRRGLWESRSPVQGGTGKTTTSVALAQFVRRQGVSVALGDRYPQGNVTGRVVTDRTALDEALTAANLGSFEAHYQAGRVYSLRRPRRSSRPGRDYRMKQAAGQRLCHHCRNRCARQVGAVTDRGRPGLRRTVMGINCAL
jgi:hypothetical protein